MNSTISAETNDQETERSRSICYQYGYMVNWCLIMGLSLHLTSSHYFSRAIWREAHYELSVFITQSCSLYGHYEYY